MARTPHLRGDDFITPGMAYHGTIGVPDRMVGRDSQGRPMYQADEVVVRPATPQQGLRELDNRELGDDARDTARMALQGLGSYGGGAAASKVAGTNTVIGALKEAAPKVVQGLKLAGPAFALSSQLHQLLGHYLSNEDVGAHDIMASRALMPNQYNPSDDDPETRSNGAYVDTGDGPATYIQPSYVGHSKGW